MKQQPYSWIALGVAGLIALILLRFGPGNAAEGSGLPLLTSLFLAEFGFLVSAVGAVLGIRAWFSGSAGMAILLSGIACALLAVGFGWTGLAIWSDKVAVP